MQISNKSHKLSSKTTPKNRVYLTVYLELVLDFVPIIHTNKVSLIFLQKDPLLRLDYKSIYKAKLPTFVGDIDFFDDLSFEVNIVNLVDTGPNDIIFFFMGLIKVDAVEGKIRWLLITHQWIAIVPNDAIWIQRKHYDLRLMARILLFFDIGAKNIEVICKHERFERLIEGYFSTADNLHSHLIVKVDKVVLFLDDVSVVVWVKVN